MSAELRRLIDYALRLEIDRETHGNYNGVYFSEKFRRVAKDLHVLFHRQPVGTYRESPQKVTDEIAAIVARGNLARVFDLVEFFLLHHGCSGELKRELTSAFVRSRAAYRIFDNGYIVAIGTEAQAAGFEGAIASAESRNAVGARRHLLAAGVALRNGDWAGSVRESIHAVESVAVRLAPSGDTLSAALKEIDKQGHLHGALRAAFEKLYGYSSDEAGVRHALVFSDEADVDEADALFMLGACASFVSYLLARGEGGSRSSAAT
jgi:hypothetical protein